jgi:hypothetical protein
MTAAADKSHRLGVNDITGPAPSPGPARVHGDDVGAQDHQSTGSGQSRTCTRPTDALETADLDVSPLFAAVLGITAEVSSDGDFGHNIDVLATDAFNETMYDGVQAMSDQRTPEEVAADLEAAAQE